MRRFIIDTDVGADDAVAIMVALRHPEIQVEVITTVAGNVSVEQATRNALYIAELCGADVPIYRGMGRPMLREPSNAQSVHGQDGLGDLGLNPPQGQPQAEHAVDALIRHVMAAPGEITLVALGPLTNVALALLKEPGLTSALSGMYMMGGAVNALGNVTPSAEFNVWADPEAAKLVLHSGLPVTMVGWELIWGEMLLNAEEMDRLQTSGSACAAFAVECTRKVVGLFEQFVGAPALPLPDAIAVAMAIDRSVCRTEKLYVTVETVSELTRGETVVDRFGVLGQPPNVEVCFDPDAAQYKEMLFDVLT
jgi:purine nucleosidase